MVGLQVRVGRGGKGEKGGFGRQGGLEGEVVKARPGQGEARPVSLVR